jgi:hypothetical protein
MPKRYTLICVVCGREAEVARRDATTCSTKCRVWLHRHPEHWEKVGKAETLPLSAAQEQTEFENADLVRSQKEQNQ